MLDAAREIFERDGYVNTRVTDIADRAKVAHGTFYTYFDSKHDVFHELAQEAVQELDRVSVGSEETRDLPPRQALRDVTRQYLRAYRSQAPILALIHHAATYGDELGDLRDAVRERLASRNEQFIRHFQRLGLASGGIDPRYAGAILGSMMSSFAYDWLVLGAEFEEEGVVDTITHLWAGGIGLAGDGSD